MIIRVASGLIVHGSTVLMGLRKPVGMRPNLWELPGGKVEENEQPKQALIREWEEELGVHIFPSQIGPLLASSTLETESTFVVELYPVLYDQSFRPQAKDHVELRWIEPDYAVRHMPCSPAFYLHYRAIMAWIKEVVGQ